MSRTTNDWSMKFQEGNNEGGNVEMHDNHRVCLVWEKIRGLQKRSEILAMYQCIFPFFLMSKKKKLQTRTLSKHAMLLHYDP